MGLDAVVVWCVFVVWVTVVPLIWNVAAGSARKLKKGKAVPQSAAASPGGKRSPRVYMSRNVGWQLLVVVDGPLFRALNAVWVTACLCVGGACYVLDGVQTPSMLCRFAI